MGANCVLNMLTTNARAASYLVDILSGDGYFGDPTLTARLSDPRETNRLVDTVAPKYCRANSLTRLGSSAGRREFAAVALRTMMHRDDDPAKELTDVEVTLVKLGVVEYNVDVSGGGGGGAVASGRNATHPCRV
mgnify:CR=1 FL=1